ncbi:MAG TPA: helix-turn-helix domain-containing protein [Puia sp.]|jgi:AraC-like DNA-binding protein|nr:helix-turn-helix domain-containing protein [Puia sp.]
MTEIFDNIREIYDFSLPCEPLRPFIEFFSESSRDRTARLAAGNPFTVEMFPSWTPTFWINLGVPYQLTTGQVHYKISTHDDILVLRDTPTARYNHSADHLFTVKFFPGGLESILGVSQTNFIGKVVPLRHILPARLLDDLKCASCTSQRIALLEDFFLASLPRQLDKDHYTKLVRDSIGLYENTAMLPNTGQLAERLFIHSKAINRYFHRVVGLPPKRYFSIVRTRMALTSYFADPTNFSAADFGYYDQSHFYKAVRQFTGRRITDRL